MGQRKKIKEQQGAKRTGVEKKNGPKPMWPYMFFSSIPVCAFCLYITVFPPEKAKVISGPVGVAGKGAPREVPIEQLEAQMQQIHAGLAGVAGRGDSDIFQKIQGMASVAEDVLNRANAASTKAEKRAILEKGMESRSEMLAALMDRSSELKKEDEDDQVNAPLTLDPVGHVAQLTRDTFPDYMARNPRTMVEFFAPWCGHCKKLAPEYEKVAKQFKGQAGFAAVDATSEDQLARIYSVSGYPTLKWFFRGHKVADYDGPRTSAKIIEWVERRLEPAYSELEEATDLTGALEASGEANIAICAGAGIQGSNLHSAFEVAAEQFRGKFLFVWTPAATESIAFHQRDQEPIPCLDGGRPCDSADKVTAWLDAVAAVMLG